MSPAGIFIIAVPEIKGTKTAAIIIAANEIRGVSLKIVDVVLLITKSFLISFIKSYKG